MTIVDCRFHRCPCSQPEQPPAGHQCPSDGLTDEQREIEREHQLNRPWADDLDVGDPVLIESSHYL